MLAEFANRAISQILVPYHGFIYWKLGRSDLTLLNRLREWQYASNDQIYAWKWAQIRRLLQFAAEKVPYYQSLFKSARIDIARIKDIEAYEQTIPVLQKQDILAHHDRLNAITNPFPPVIHNSTGGSTGQTVQFLLDRHSLSYRGATQLLHLTWCGWAPWEKRAYIWGSRKDLANTWGHLSFRRSQWLENRVFFNAFAMTPQAMHGFYRELVHRSPKILIGYANALYLFAQFLHGAGLSPPKIGAIQSSAEMLIPEMRATIESAFGTKLFDSYGSRELSSIAHECERHRGLHIAEHTTHLEITRPGGVFDPASGGESGPILVTNLMNYAFPLLRYEIGDIGALDSSHQCDCGRTWRRLRDLEGRMTDFITTPGGKNIHGTYFTHIFYHQPFVADFQVIQNDPASVLIRYVLSPSIQPGMAVDAWRANLEKQIHHECDPRLRLTWEQANQIEPLRSGKRHFIISTIPANF